jgi:hypothetical protein
MTMSDSSTHHRAEARTARAKCPIAPNPFVRHTVERRSKPAWLALRQRRFLRLVAALLAVDGERREIDPDGHGDPANSRVPTLEEARAVAHLAVTICGGDGMG